MTELLQDCNARVDISVLMCVYNGERWLREAVQSILNQTKSDFEFVIVDDASTDQTSKLLKAFEKEDKRIKVLTNETNLGLTKSLNLGLKQCSGVYVARQDADDVSMPNRLEKQLKAAKLSGAAIITSDCAIIDEQGLVTGQLEVEDDDASIRERLFWHNALVHGSVLFNKETVISAGGYDESFRVAQDYELWFRLASNGLTFHPVKEVLYQLRTHDTSISATKRNEQQRSEQRAKTNALNSFRKKTAALILSHNKIDQTLECIGKCLDMGIHTFVLDNASSALSKRLLRLYCVRNKSLVTLIERDSNTGVSKGRNILIQEAKKSGYDFLLFLDNDLLAPEFSIDVFFRHVFMFPHADAYIPRLFNRHDGCYMGKYTLSVSENRVQRENCDGMWSNYFLGGASLVRMSIFDKNGLYDENMFVGYEDYEFSLRFLIEQKRPLKALFVDKIDFLHSHLPPLLKSDIKSIAKRYDTKANQQSLDLLEQKLGLSFAEKASGYTEIAIQKFQAAESRKERLIRWIRFLEAVIFNRACRGLISKIRKMKNKSTL